MFGIRALFCGEVMGGRSDSLRFRLRVLLLLSVGNESAVSMVTAGVDVVVVDDGELIGNGLKL